MKCNAGHTIHPCSGLQTMEPNLVATQIFLLQRSGPSSPLPGSSSRVAQFLQSCIILSFAWQDDQIEPVDGSCVCAISEEDPAKHEHLQVPA